MENTQVIDINEIAKKAADEAIKGYKFAQAVGAPAQQTQAVSESLVAPRKTIMEFAKGGDYKKALIEALKDQTPAQMESGRILNEAIGAADGSAAIPTIWAKDVTRLQVYPASAFWDNPYVHWINDVKGQAGGTVYAITVKPMVAGTAGCAEPVSTAPVIAAVPMILSEYQCSFYLCRNDMEDMVEDTVTQLNDSLVSCLDQVADSHFIAALVATASGSVGAGANGTAYIGPADFAAAIGTMRSGNQPEVGYGSYIC